VIAIDVLEPREASGVLQRTEIMINEQIQDAKADSSLLLVDVEFV